MFGEYVSYIFNYFCFVFVVIIPAIIITPFIFWKDLIYLFVRRGRPDDPDRDPSEVSDSSVPAPADSDMKTTLKTARSIVAAATSAGTRKEFAGAPKLTSWVDAAANPNHLGGIPRRIVLSSVGTFACIVTSALNKVKVYNMDRLKDLIHHRPANTPLITVSNHMSTLDDPLQWGIWTLEASDARICRWTLTAKDICFTNPYVSYFFRLGKCIPIDRWGSVHQDCMFEAIDLINKGEWLHTFPEGTITQDHLPIKRLKWGVASVIARCSNPPIVLCIGLSGFEKVMPEKHLFGKRAAAPLWGKNISIVVGEPIQFDIPALRLEAEEAVRTGDKEFGKDALQPLEEEATDGTEVNALVAKAAIPLKEKEEKIAGVGDEVTRRLYSEISARMRTNLEALVFKAHGYSEERR